MVKNSNITLKCEKEYSLLQFLYERLPNLPKGKVKSYLEHGMVQVNSKVTTKYNYNLLKGYVVVISTKYVEKPKECELLDFLYEDESIIVINKPAGLLSVADDKEKENTAYRLVTMHVRMNNPQAKIFIVHRLDRDTSGILIFAKNERTKLKLQDNWDNMVLYRGYMAVAEGVFKQKEGKVISFLKETKTHLVYSTQNSKDGKKAITNYKVLKENKIDEYSLLDIFIETGRKNQIRVHLKDLGHSIVGDKKYSAKSNPLKRLALHAHRLEFIHPTTNEMLKFELPIPAKFNSLFKNQ